MNAPESASTAEPLLLSRASAGVVHLTLNRPQHFNALSEQMLAELGYPNVVDMRGGFSGEGDMTGRIVDPGWEACGLPVEKDPAPAGRAWAQLSKKSG